MNIRQLEIELDNAWYGHDGVNYDAKLASIKSLGYKVFRNPEGRHKVQKIKTEDWSNAYGGVFGDIFGDIFKGGN